MKIVKSRSAIVCGAAVFGLIAVSPLHASITHRYSFTTDASDSIGGANGTAQGVATVSGGQLQLNNPNFSAGIAVNPNDGYASLPASILPTSGGATIEEWFTAQGSGFFAESYTFSNGVSGGFQPSGAGGDYLIQAISAPQPAVPPGGANTGGNHIEETTSGYSTGQQIDNYGTTPGMGAAGGGYLDIGDTYMAATVIDPSGTLSYYLYDLTAGIGGFQGSVSGIPLSSFNFTTAYLGRSPFDVDNIMSGSIDEFRIFNNAQSAANVAANLVGGPNDTNIQIPEPTSLSFLAFGVFGLLARRPARRAAAI
jgi:hypothetical protein